jgi:hypothetical protein
MRIITEEHVSGDSYGHLNSRNAKHDLLKRATTAYFRRSRGAVNGRHPTSGYVVETDDGRRYVVLALGDRFERVYRVRVYDGVLKRLKRWPLELGQLHEHYIARVHGRYPAIVR